MTDYYKNRTYEQVKKRRVIRVIPEKEHPIRIDLMGMNFIEVHYARDISLSGVGIKIVHEIEGYNLQDRVDLLIKLPPPASCSFTTPVRVIHKRDKFFGAEFESIQKKYYGMLHYYIAYRLKDESLKQRFLHKIRLFL